MTQGPASRHPGFRPWREQRRPAAASRVRLYAGGIAATIAAACYSSFLVSPWTHPRSAASGGFVSELEDPGQPFAWLYRGSDILAGLGVLTAAWALRAWRPAAGVFLLAVTGASSMLDAAASMPCDPATSARRAQHEHTTSGLIGQLPAPHTDSGLLGFLASAAGAAILGAALTGRWMMRTVPGITTSSTPRRRRAGGRHRAASGRVRPA